MVVVVRSGVDTSVRGTSGEQKSGE